MACSDDRVSLSVGLPAGFEGLVQRVTVDVLDPPGEVWTCDSVAFGERSAAELQSVLVATTAATPSGSVDAALDVRREGRQLFLMRGYADDGSLLVAGCAERGGGNVGRLQLSAIAVGRVDAQSPLELFDGELYGELPGLLAVTVRNALGGPFDGAVVKWTIDGPGQYFLSDETVSDAAGLASYEPTLGTLSGPYRVRATTRWAVGTTPELVSFERREPRFVALPEEPRRIIAIPVEREPSGAAVVGGIGADGCASSIFLSRDASEPKVFPVPGCALLAAVGAGASDIPVALVVNSPEPPRVAHIRLPNGEAQDCGILSLPATAYTCEPVEVFDADPCSHSGRLLVEVACRGPSAPAGRSYRVMDVSRCPAVDLGAVGFANLGPNIGLSSVGCLDIDGSPQNVAVGAFETREVLYREDSPAEARRVRGVTEFYDFTRDGERHALLGLGSNAGKLQLVRFSVSDIGADVPYETAVSAAFEVPVPPLVASTADFDGDGVADVFALTRSQSSSGSAFRSVVLCIGREGAAPICAVGFDLRTEGRDITAVSDLDGDGVFDFVGVDYSGGGWRLLSNSLLGNGR